MPHRTNAASGTDRCTAVRETRVLGHSVRSTADIIWGLLISGFGVRVPGGSPGASSQELVVALIGARIGRSAAPSCVEGPFVGPQAGRINCCIRSPASASNPFDGMAVEIRGDRDLVGVESRVLGDSVRLGSGSRSQSSLRPRCTNDTILRLGEARWIARMTWCARSSPTRSG